MFVEDVLSLQVSRHDSGGVGHDWRKLHSGHRRSYHHLHHSESHCLPLPQVETHVHPLSVGNAKHSNQRLENMSQTSVDNKCKNYGRAFSLLYGRVFFQLLINFYLWKMKLILKPTRNYYHNLLKEWASLWYDRMTRMQEEKKYVRWKLRL